MSVVSWISMGFVKLISWWRMALGAEGAGVGVVVWGSWYCVCVACRWHSSSVARYLLNHLSKGVNM